ncbi:MAG: hypothetical protein IT384_15585 [Deltaproteobacteria bacterium]|nr:hypothetical protein [Deltaproteobacteria bacterium]
MSQWIEFDVPEVLAGFAINSARANERVELLVQGFFTSDDGPQLYQYLDDIYASVLRRGTNLGPEDIKVALINIRRNRASMLLNPPLEMLVVTTRGVEKGAPVCLDDLADVVSVRFPGHDLPSDGALVFIFQQRWRRGLYFDLRHAHDPKQAPIRPLGDVSALLGSLWCALLHRDRIRMDSSVLAKMAAGGWFPFTRLSTSTVMSLYKQFELGWDPSEVVERACAEITPHLPAIVDAWAKKPAFEPHIGVLRDAARLYTQGEHRAAATMIWPKIEGVLRHIYAGTKDRPNAHDLRRELAGRIRANVNGYTALLPERFIAYLETYYYASFDLAKGDVSESRHAFAHGVGPDDRMVDPTYALRLFLMLDQVFFCLSRMKEPTSC